MIFETEGKIIIKRVVEKDTMKDPEEVRKLLNMEQYLNDVVAMEVAKRFGFAVRFHL